MGIEILKDKREAILHLATRYGVERMRVFGSMARGQASSDSDIDFLVAFRRGRTLLDLIGLTVWSNTLHPFPLGPAVNPSTAVLIPSRSQQTLPHSCK